MLLISCKVPRDSVIFYNSNISPSKKIQSIPSEWEGRLLSISKKKFEVGGEISHRHVIMHDHIDTSEGPEGTYLPLGLVKTTASATHNHYISTYLQSPQISSLSEYDVKAKELNAYITKRALSRIPTGLIILYIGNSIPAYWQPCDGTNGSPNLSDVYIRLRQQNCSAIISGSNTHNHNVTHSHKWSVLTPDINNNLNKALAVDEIVYEGDTVTLNIFSHIHGVIENAMPVTYTKAKEIFPPSIYIGFIQAKTGAKKIPPGGLLPTIRLESPWGWSKWVPTGNEDNQFVYGTNNKVDYLKTFGSHLHNHEYEHEHKILLTAVPHQIQQSSTGVNVSISRAYHTHNVTITDPSKNTDDSNSLPRYISFSFIIKK